MSTTMTPYDVRKAILNGEPLPDSLSVDGDLYLGGCTGLTSLPDSLRVAGNLYLDGCTGLTTRARTPKA